ncbi:Hypothetical predicted protein, partial [Olea europaea subsp. europaea]
LTDLNKKDAYWLLKNSASESLSIATSCCRHSSVDSKSATTSFSLRKSHRSGQEKVEK